MATATEAPTVSVRIGTETCAFDERGEIIATVEYHEDGTPDWTEGGVADARGGGEAEGFRLLHAALTGLEENARLCGFEVTRIPA